jgi:hypothetical protein
VARGCILSAALNGWVSDSATGVLSKAERLRGASAWMTMVSTPQTAVRIELGAFSLASFAYFWTTVGSLHTGGSLKILLGFQSPIAKSPLKLVNMCYSGDPNIAVPTTRLSNDGVHV